MCIVRASAVAVATIVLAAAPPAAAQPVAPAPAAVPGAPVAVPGEIVVAFMTDPQAPAGLEDLLAGAGLELAVAPRVDGEPDVPAEDVDAPREPGLVAVDDARRLLQWIPRGQDDRMTLVLLRADAAAADALAAELAGRPDVAWVAPNRAILGDPRELVPNDPQFGSQYHHPLMDNLGAWDITLGSPSVIIAITDDGMDMDHEDLVENLWTNAGEIPGNGFDDDGNGYADDVNGWDVLFDDNDPNPNNGGDDHGTHVAGIAAARTGNGIGVAGTAGEASLMPIQFYASGQAWTAANIAEAFGYAADNGARIIGTSYNINGWVGDPIVTAAFDALYDQGVLHFNSAGNGDDLNPPRQAFHQTFLVVNTTASDQRSGSSNYGTGVDVSAPGSSILSTVLNDGYGTKSGTSMAAPNAAGAAALIWSANPSWTRDQVVAQLLGTADDIDAQNPGFEGLLGSGRVNSFRALTETLPAPRVREATGLPVEGETLFGGIAGAQIRFDQVMDPAAVNAIGAFTLTAAGPDGSFGTADDVVTPIAVEEYLTGANRVVLLPPTAELPAGAYRFDADASVLANPFGTSLDGDGDGVPGGSFSRSFTLCPGTVISEDTLESGAGWTVVNTAISDGAWDASPAVPVGGGDRGDPAADFDGSGKCFLTDNADGNSDVDGGPTRLISPAIDLAGLADPWVSYARWFSSDDADVFVVEASDDDGASWSPVELVQAAAGAWAVTNVRVAEVFPEIPSSVRLRFTASDNPNDSVVEAAVDRLRVLTFDCSGGPVIPGDIDGDGVVGIADLLAVLAAWGPCGEPCPADVDGDGAVSLGDLLVILAEWD